MSRLSQSIGVLLIFAIDADEYVAVNSTVLTINPILVPFLQGRIIGILLSDPLNNSIFLLIIKVELSFRTRKTSKHVAPDEAKSESESIHKIQSFCTVYTNIFTLTSTSSEPLVVILLYAALPAEMALSTILGCKPVLSIVEPAHIPNESAFTQDWV